MGENVRHIITQFIIDTYNPLWGDVVIKYSCGHDIRLINEKLNMMISSMRTPIIVNEYKEITSNG